MNFKFKKFTITKLFGAEDLEIKIENNIIVFIAENGQGKTTILRMIYYFLSKQWSQLLGFNFDSIIAEINNTKVKFIRSEYVNLTIGDLNLASIKTKYPIYKDFIEANLSKRALSDLQKNTYKLNELEAEFDVPINLLVRIVNELSDYQFRNIKTDWTESIIYLPTFRRIERDFNDLFKDLDKRLESKIKAEITKASSRSLLLEEKQIDYNLHDNYELNRVFTDLWNSRDTENWKNREQENSHIELIEFGMSDVKYKIRHHLNTNNESDVNTFIAICNSYLTKTSLELDIKSKTVVVKSHRNREIDLNDLSSGEKQIISIFSHLHLVPKKPIVIIDEPELSLSIAWQERILDDIMNSGTPSLIVATHSPFIVTEKVKNFTHGLNEFIK